MTKKQRIARKAPGLAILLERHSYWTSGNDEASHLLNILALHYRVPMEGFPYSALGQIGDGPNKLELLEMVLALAADLYPAFEKPPSRGGRPRQYASGLLDPYPDAHAARLVQLFAVVKKQKNQRGEPAAIADICEALVQLCGGKYPNWQYNGLRTGASLKRRAWDVISSEIKAHPESFLPADGSEPTWYGGLPYLPPLPVSTKDRQ